jgi:peptide/nickel transport system substrate-binding protein
MKIRVGVPAALVALVIGLASCSQSNAGSGSSLLRVGTVAAQGSTLDPLKTQGCATDYCGLFMERLMKFGSDGKLQPQLAASVSQPDSRTYVYHLRHGVKFWDGNEMTSADVVGSLEYQSAPGSQTATYYTNVQSIEADDRYTVTVTLKHPDDSWPYTVAYEGVIFEKSFLDAHKTTMGNPGVLIQATGPWKIDSFNPTTGIELSANPFWWGGKVPFERISFKFFATEQNEALAMRSGDIDVAFPNSRAFASTSGAKIVSWPNNNIGFLAMNVNIAPWNDIHVRRAVAFALNRDDIIAANGGSSYASALFTLDSVSDDLFGLRTLGTAAQVDAATTSIQRYQFDLAEAKQEIAASAYPHGFSASIDIADFGNFPDIAQIVQANMRRIGIDLQIKTVTTDAWITELYGKKDFGVALVTSHSSSPDPSGQTSYLLGSQNIPAGGLNYAAYAPPEVDKLLADGLATSDPAQRLRIYAQILTHVADDVPYVPLYQTRAFAALSNAVTMPPLNMLSFESQWALQVKPGGQG